MIFQKVLQTLYFTGFSESQNKVPDEVLTVPDDFFCSHVVFCVFHSINILSLIVVFVGAFNIPFLSIGEQEIFVHSSVIAEYLVSSKYFQANVNLRNSLLQLRAFTLAATLCFSISFSLYCKVGQLDIIVEYFSSIFLLPVPLRIISVVI